MNRLQYSGHEARPVKNDRNHLGWQLDMLGRRFGTVADVLLSLGWKVAVRVEEGNGFVEMSESLNSYSNGSINTFAELGAFIEAQNEFRKLLHTKDLIVWSEGSRVSLEAVVLTKREKSVRSLLIAGRSSAEIANTLGISKKTVEKHIERIYHKYDVTSFCEFVATYRF